MKYFFKTLLELPVWSDVARAQGRYVFERLCPAGGETAGVPDNAAMWGDAAALPEDILFDSPAAEALGALTLLIRRAAENGSSALRQDRSREELLKLPDDVEKHYRDRKTKNIGHLEFVRNPMVQERLRKLQDLLGSPDFLKDEAGKSEEADFFTDRIPDHPASVLDLRSAPEPLSDGVSPEYAPETAPDPGDLLKPLVFSMGNFYFSRYYAAETAIAGILNERFNAPWSRFDFGGDSGSGVSDLRKVLDWLFSPDPGSRDTVAGPDWQKAAVGMSFLHPVTVITGGPGTGKTTTVAKLLAAIMLLETASGSATGSLSIALAAPTGKAAARMKESLGNSIGDSNIRLRDRMEEAARDLRVDPDLVFAKFQECLNVHAVTLHTLLGMHPGSLRAPRNRKNPLPQDLLIVDEVSMVDILMMQNLLDALKPGAALIMLGDHNQLASVSAGTVLGDICSVLDLEHASGLSDRDRRLISGITGISEADLSPKNIADGIVRLVYSRRFDAKSRIGQLAFSVNEANDAKMLDILREQDGTNLFWCDGKDRESGEKRISGDGMLAERLYRTACPGEKSENFSGFKEYFDKVIKVSALCYDRGGGALTEEVRDDLENGLVDIFKAVNGFRVLTPVHDGVLGDKRLNQHFNEKYCEYVNAGLKNNESPSGTDCDYDGDWYPGKVFMVTRNNRDWDLHNGDVVIAGWDPEFPGSRRIWAEKVSGEEKTAEEDTSGTEGAGNAMDSGEAAAGSEKKASRYVSLPFSMIPNLTTGYVLTVHKSQGSEFLHTVIVMPEDNGENTSRELLYTGITRARKRLSVYGTAETLKKATLRGTERSSGLAARLRINGKS